MFWDVATAAESVSGKAAQGLLSGTRVIELADESGCYCGKLFADMGADVVKVEPPGGDPSRGLPPHAPDGGKPGLFFRCNNSGKRAVTLDLEHPGARELFAGLVARADLLIQTTPAGYLDERGLGYGQLSQANPALVACSITPHGRSGPRAHWEASALTVEAMSGSMHVTGYAVDPPGRLAGRQAWTAAGSWAAASSMIALWHARNSGQGQLIDISATECLASVAHITGVGKYLDDGIVPRRSGPGLFASVPSGAYRCKDGLVYLMVNRPAHWKALATWINETTGNEEVLDPMFEGASSARLPHRELLDIFIGELTERFTVDEIYREGQRRRIAFSPVNTLADLAGDEQLAARGYFVEGEDGLRYPGAPFRHSATPWQGGGHVPAPGEHNRELLLGELGLDAERFEQLVDEGAL